MYIVVTSHFVICEPIPREIHVEMNGNKSWLLLQVMANVKIE